MKKKNNEIIHPYVGKKAIVVAPHPHAGERVDVLKIDYVDILGKTGLLCKNENGDEFFVFQRQRLQLI